MVSSNKLGAVYQPDNTVFSVFSEHAQKIELCLFSDDEKTETRIPMRKNEQNVWSASLAAIRPGQKYGYRAYGEYDPSRGLFFNPAKLAADPYGLAVSREIQDWENEGLRVDNNQDSAALMPKSVVTENNPDIDAVKYPFLRQRPNIPWGRNVIYEAHVKNFSFQNFDLPEQERGRLIAFANPLVLDYLEKLGVNNIELLPITPNCPSRHLKKEKGYTDSWGYNPYCHFAVNPRYGSLEDLKAVVNALHSRGMKLTLDVVFNHTGEYRSQGFYGQALSYKLLDSPNYYNSNGDDKANYSNYTGCDNNFNLNSPAGQKVLHDFLTFVHEIGVDGLRFDLGGDNALNQYGQFQENGGFIQELRYAREQLNLDISVEPWSALGGNYSGHFAGRVKGVKEWSDRRHKFDAAFFSSQPGLQGEFATQVAGSALIDADGKTSAVIGTGRSHDGFSLVGAFEHYKNTWPNGEEGRDGSPDHYRKSSDRGELYRRAISNAAFDILSKGVPFMRAGDERGYSSPNNNPYCIDDSSVWLNWNELNPENKALFLNICRLNAFRQRHPVFQDLELFDGCPVDANGAKDITWLRPDGNEMEAEDWQVGYARTGAYMLNGQNNKGKPEDDHFLIMASGDDYHTVGYKLPSPPGGGSWQLVFDSSEQGFVSEDRAYKAGETYGLRPFSYVILTHKRERGRQREMSMEQLARLQKERYQH